MTNDEMELCSEVNELLSENKKLKERNHDLEEGKVKQVQNDYKPLKMFYELARKYFGCSTPQDMEHAIIGFKKFYEDHQKCFFDLINELEAKVPKWISVEDRLPNEYEYVLTHNKQKEFTVSYYRNGWINGVNVTHWMPLPQPPKS